jgi:rSAM/selenodomain-associated transferase 1
MKENALIIFVKNPEPGKVKTRIAKSVGNEKAVEIYKQLLDFTSKIVQNVDCTRYVYYFPMVLENDEFPSSLFNKELQIKGDLGQKMETAFTEVLKRHKSVMIVGSDCAELTSEDIKRGFEELEENDVVIGPAKDGGYYLLGMNDLQLFLFKDMPWSSETLLDESIMKVQDRGLNYSLLNIKSDIDYIEDWEAQKHLVL